MSLSDEEPTRNSESRYQYIFKIILIGSPGSGKSSILHRFIHGNFEEKYNCTLGVDFYMKTLDLSENFVKLQIWDTAGMEKYKSLTTSYYRGSHAAFIIFDLTKRDTFDAVPRWLEAYNKNISGEQNRVIILVGNKKDLSDERQISTEEAKSLADSYSMAYFETSAKDGVNVNEIFTFISERLIEVMGSGRRSEVSLLDRDNNFSNVIISGEEKKISRCPCKL